MSSYVISNCFSHLQLSAWLTEKKAAQEKLAKHENPVLKTEELTVKVL